ncbi:MAG: DUF1304 domain-containing protein [Burkholderiales bacterium]|nr:DUF1304 domain-containing protein [Burkholderiales bacterium]
MIFNLSVYLVSFIHLIFFILESYLFNKPIGIKVFRLNDEKLKYTKAFAINQGYYNLCLSIGLLVGIWLNNHQLTLFILSSIVVLGIVGAFTVSKRIFYLQSIPAIVSLVLFFVKF